MKIAKKISKKHISAFLLFVVAAVGFVTFADSIIAFASTDLGNVVNSIKSTTQTVMGSNPRNKVLGLSREVYDIVNVGIMAVVLASGLVTGAKYAGAGDNPQAKAALKQRLIYHIFALIFLASYMGFVYFAFSNFKMF